MSNKRLFFYTILLSLLAADLFAADDVSTYLILNDISPYKRLVQTHDAYSHKLKTIPGYTSHPGAGVLTGADHFIADHPDMTYETKYQNDTLGVSVQITKHPGYDSDKWLSHEMEDEYRDGELENLGLMTKGTRIRDINGNKIISLRGSSYSWIDNYVVIEISYTDLNGNKPEPLEVIQAYLQKFPSTIPASLVFDKAHDTIWIKDEMERRLWLCDKWFYQLQLGKVQQNQVYQESVKSMNIFLDYREKYYGIRAADEKNLLASSLNANNGTAIKAKLTEYKNWWSLNKDKSISL